MWRITNTTHLNAFVIKPSMEKVLKKVNEIEFIFLIDATASNDEHCNPPFLPTTLCLLDISYLNM